MQHPRIVVGVDGSTPSSGALDWAFGVARDRNLPLLLVHVVDDEWGGLGSQYAAAERDAGAHLLAEAARRAQARGLEVTEELRQGSPAWELAAAAGADDLLVIGTHKTGFVHGRVLGSRSVVAASASSATVAVIPDVVVRARSGVLVGVAGEWESAVATGARLAARGGIELSVLHAAHGDDLDAARALLDRAVAHAQRIEPGLAVHSRVSRRDPAEGLLDAARTTGTLVLGPSRRDAASGGYLGSVTHDVLLNLTTPVVIARGGVL